MKLNYIYRNSQGEYFKSEDKNGQIVLSNPSYPFVFLPQVQEPLEEVGSAEEFEHLIEKVDSQFYEGETISVEITDEGLKVKE